MPEPAYVYLVMGTTGEYSGRDEWPVAAYLEEEIAQWHVRLVSTWARQWETKYQSEYEVEDPPDGWCPLDPKMCMKYTGTSYYYLKAPLGQNVLLDPTGACKVLAPPDVIGSVSWSKK